VAVNDRRANGPYTMFNATEIKLLENGAPALLRLVASAPTLEMNLILAFDNATANDPDASTYVSLSIVAIDGITLATPIPLGVANDAERLVIPFVDPIAIKNELHSTGFVCDTGWPLRHFGCPNSTHWCTSSNLVALPWPQRPIPNRSF